MFDEKYRNHFAGLSIEVKMETFVEILRRVKFIHDKGVIHCELKMSTILTASPDNKKDLVVVDFGISKNGSKCEIGTIGYEATEVDLKKESGDFEVNTKADT